MRCRLLSPMIAMSVSLSARRLNSAARRRVQGRPMRSHSIQPLPNHFGLLFCLLSSKLYFIFIACTITNPCLAVSYGKTKSPVGVLLSDIVTEHLPQLHALSVCDRRCCIFRLVTSDAGAMRTAAYTRRQMRAHGNTSRALHSACPVTYAV